MINKKKIKVMNVRNGKILYISQAAIDVLKKMRQFHDYDILPDEELIQTQIIEPINEVQPVNENPINDSNPESITKKKRKKKSENQ